MLRIADNLKLPDEAVTQTFAILAKRGVGKTYTASVMVEEMLKNNLPVVVLDPIGVWWGLRSSADGKKPGMSIIIAGGDHADIPLTPDNGEIMANLVIDEKLSIVIDLSLFRKGEQIKFVTDFAETLYHRNRTALHIVIDEADAFAPQRTMPNEARMLGAMEDLVRRGRARGIGVTMITQRPSVLNKNVLTQIEVLVALRMTAPLDQKAIDDWIRTHAEEGQREEFMESLPSLPIGTAWFWSPGWLDIFTRVKVRTRETLDSSSTPKVGKIKIEPRKMAEVNLDKLRDQLSETIAKVESEDPKILKRRIIELESQLKKKQPEIKEVIKEVPIITDEQIQALTTACLTVQQVSDDIISSIKKADYKHVPPAGYPPVLPPKAKLKNFPGVPDGTEVNLMDYKHDQPRQDATEGKSIGSGEFKVLAAAGQHPAGITRTHLTILTGYKRSSRNTYISRLAAQGYIEVTGDVLTITDAGIAKLGNSYDPLPTGDALRQRLLTELPAGEKSILQTLIDAYPAALSRDDITDKTGYQRSSRNTYLSRMNAREIVEVRGQEVKASDLLFA